MKQGFIHIYDCNEELVEEFKEFCKEFSCDRMNGGLKFLLEFHKTFKKIRKEEDNKPSVLKSFGGNKIKLGDEKK